MDQFDLASRKSAEFRGGEQGYPAASSVLEHLSFSFCKTMLDRYNPGILWLILH
jgi:hypothetical protein